MVNTIHGIGFYIFLMEKGKLGDGKDDFGGGRFVHYA
jgi:hypothetical protein